MQEGTDPEQSQAPSLEDLAPLFPAYEFEGFIAEGGMGWVYLARQISLDRPVAIKILQRELGEDPEFRASFEREAKAMARLNHSNLIGVYDFGDADGLPFIVMEFVHGKSLHHSAYGRAIDPAQAGNLVSAISRGLAHAHNAGILHRDIKPGNILLDPDAKPKIGDFGLAQPIGQQAGAEEAIYGTPGYTAPEVYQRRGDHRADIFSVGTLLHELLTGALPDAQRTPPSFLCGCPRAFDVIVARATNPNPELRYHSAEELADELDKAVEKYAAGATASSNRLILPSSAPAPVVARTGGVGVAPRVAAIAPRGAVPASGALARAQLQAQAQKNSPALVIWIVGVVFVIIVVAILASGGGGKKKGNDLRKNRPSTFEPTLAPDPGSGRGPSPEPTPDRGGQPEQPPENPAPPEEEVVAKPVTVSPLVALARLKEPLAAGSREEYPPGTEARGGNHFLLVDQAMTWDQARVFAEDHGAHLAILPDVTDRKWFREKFPSAEPVWIGAGMAANDQWQWLDSTGWNLQADTIAAAPDQRRLTLKAGGELAADAGGKPFHAALQWRDDGTNPATTGAQLKRTADSLKELGFDAARFPVGTLTFPAAKSHFFHLAKATSWEAAGKLAVATGGYLAVPSSKAESDWIRAAFGSLSSAEGHLWIGGYRLKGDSSWQWLTREAWNYPGGWLGGAAPVPSTTNTPTSRLLLQLGAGVVAGWVADEGGEGAANGMLIEWSPPKQAATIRSFDLGSWLGATDANFVSRIQADIEAFEKERGLIIDRYIRNIKRLGRKYESALAGRDGQGRIRDAVKGVVREVEKSGKLLAEVPTAAPDEFQELQSKSENSLRELDAEFQKKLSGQLGVYTQGLVKQAAELSKDGFDAPSSILKERVDSLNGQPEAFISLLGLTDPTETAKKLAEAKKKEDEKKKETAKKNAKK